MTKKNLFFLFSCLIMLILFSCVTSYNEFEDSLLGHYENALKAKTEVYYYNYIKQAKGTVMGTKLDLYDDRSFKYEFCGVIYSGKFEVEDKNLQLNYSTIQSKVSFVDSTHKMAETLKEKGFFDFKIKDDKLIGVVNGITLKGKSLNKLIKND